MVQRLERVQCEICYRKKNKRCKFKTLDHKNVNKNWKEFEEHKVHCSRWEMNMRCIQKQKDKKLMIYKK